jgi:DNA adenine methylase
LVTARVLRWHGGKGKMAAKLVTLLPAHQVYTEAYGGSAAVLLEKPPSQFEVYNDLNGDLVNFYRVLRNEPEELIRQIELTPYARDEYATAGDEVEDPIERARRFMVASWMTVAGFDGKFRSVTDWRRLLRSDRPAPPSRQWASLGNRLWAAAQRLRSVQIDNKPALDILQDYDAPNVCHYIDPPYPTSTRTGPKRYPFEMNDAQHAEMLEVVIRLQGSVVISSYRNEVYDRALRSFTRHDITVPLHSTMAGRGQKRTERTECVWVRAPHPHQQATLLEVAS